MRLFYIFVYMGDEYLLKAFILTEEFLFYFANV